MSRTRTCLRRIAVVATTALMLALTPVAAFAADDTAPAATDTGGAVQLTTKVIAGAGVLYLGWRRGTVLLVLAAVGAGVMLAGTSFGGTIASLVDNLVRAGINAVTGIFA